MNPLVTNLHDFTLFFASLAGIITTSVAAYIAWRKYKPETTNIQITGANTLAEIAVKAGEFVEAQRDDLAREVAELRKDVRELRTRLEEAEIRAREVAKAAETAEHARSRAEARERAHAAEVARLWEVVQAFRSLLETAGLEVPPALQIDPEDMRDKPH